jgi:acetylornithine/succinyldiaminopimelate/putrescine aminotransferase
VRSRAICAIEGAVWCELSGLTNVFFCSTGLEANEAALKIARKYGHDKGIDRPEIIVYEAAFHGRSIATLSATGNPRCRPASARSSKASCACR